MASGCPGPGEFEEVAAFGVVQAQGAGDRLQYRLGDVGVPALFEAGVVVRAHPGQMCDFLAAQSGHPARAATEGRPRVLGAQTGPPRAQEVPQFADVVHAASVLPIAV